MDFLTQMSPWHWWALAILFLALEVLAPTTYFFWPAAAAAIIGVVLWFAPHLSLLAQVLGFVVLASVAIGIWAVAFKRRHRQAEVPHLNQRAAQYIGRRASVAR